LLKRAGNIHCIVIFSVLFFLLLITPILLAGTNKEVVSTTNVEAIGGERCEDNNNTNDAKDYTSTSETLTSPNGASPLSKALNYLRSTQSIDGKISDFGTSCWAVMAIAAAGEDPHDWKQPGGKSIVEYLIENRGQLNLNLPTDVAKFVLAMTAAREDPRNISGINYIEVLKGFFDKSQIGNPSQLNDDVWSVMALISAGENASSKIIQSSLSYIKANQNADGGWSWAIGGVSDVDDTAAALMALSCAGEDPGSNIIVKALQYLKGQQQSNGGFPCWGVINSASDSWAIGAICSVGQEPENWKVNNISVLDHLLSLQNSDGSFNWTATDPSNKALMTSYAIVALCKRQYPTNGQYIYTRIEGKQATIWRRKVFVAASIIIDDNGQVHYIPKPTVLGALDKAAEIGGFIYKVRQTSLGLYVYSIAGEEAAGLAGWMYRVDYYMPYVGMADFEWNITSPPNPPHRELLIYYGEWTYMPLKVWVDKTEIHVGENITVLVKCYNDTSNCWQPVEGATVHFFYRTYTTNATGYVVITVRYDPLLWAEKAGYIRSDVIEVKVITDPTGSTTTSSNQQNDADSTFSSKPSWRRSFLLESQTYEVLR